MPTMTVSPRRAVFIDARVPDLQTLLDGARRDHAVYVLDPERDGLGQVAAILTANHAGGVEAVHLVAHGAPGRIRLGASWLDADGLETRADRLSAIGAALGPDGALLLYGCAVAAGPEGRRFLDALSSSLGGLDVAASSTPVGAAGEGGDWRLDVSTGPVAAASPFTAAARAAYAGTLGRVTTDTQANTTTGADQYAPVTAPLSNGGYVSLWIDGSQFSSDFVYNLALRTFDASGQPVGQSEIQIKDGTSDTNGAGPSYDSVSVAGLPGGGFVVTYLQRTFTSFADNGDRTVFAEIYNNAGVKVGNTINVVENAAQDQARPGVTVFSDGSFIVSWTDAAQFDGQTDIYAQRFNASGQPVQQNGTTPGLDNFALSTFGPGPSGNDQTDGSVVALMSSYGTTNGRFAAVWTSDSQDGAANRDGIYARIFNANGTAATGEIRINDATAENQTEASIAALANGGFVVSWTDDVNGTGNLDVFYKVLDASGGVVKAATKVADDPAGVERSSCVTALKDGGFVVTWTDQSTVGNLNATDIRAQRYDASGNELGTEFVVNTTTGAYETLNDQQGDIYGAGTSEVVLLQRAGQYVATSWARGANFTSDIISNIYQMHSAPSGTDKTQTILANQTYTFQASDFGFSDNEYGAALDSFAGIVVKTVPGAGQGSLQLNGSPVSANQFVTATQIANGNLKFIPASNGTDGSFTFAVRDNGDTTTGGVNEDQSANTFTFDNSLPNTPPALTGQQAVLANGVENDSYTVTRAQLLQGYTDAEGNTLSVNSLSTNNGSITSSDGGITYTVTPTPGYDGPLQISYNVSDGTANTPASLSFTLANLVQGTAADDVLQATDRPDAFRGLAGSDTASYDGAIGEVTASLLDPSQNTGAAEDDTYDSIENLRGGDSDDTLSGNGGNNVIEGGGGGDTITGNGGIDTASYASSTEAVTINLATDEIAGGDADGDILTDITNLIGSAEADTLTGDNGSNTLTGGAGGDTLDGGTGADRLVGGLGDDTFVVDDADDLLYEGGNAGTDTVLSSVTYKLRANTENLELTGPGNLAGTGNDGANTLTGNAGANTLDGRGGADRLIGGGGDDIYIVDNTRDAVTEASGEGADVIKASVSYSLANAANVEKLQLLGNAAINATGGDAGDVLVGNAGNNRITGGLGLDKLTGGAGADVFVFDTALGSANVDTIVDFRPVDDTIRLENAIFTALSETGTLDRDAFAEIGGRSATVDESARILYDTGTGILYYDATGGDAGDREAFAVLRNKAALDFQDFEVV